MKELCYTLLTDGSNDFTPLRALSAFVALEEEIEQVVRMRGWV